MLQKARFVMTILLGVITMVAISHLVALPERGHHHGAPSVVHGRLYIKLDAAVRSTTPCPSPAYGHKYTKLCQVVHDFTGRRTAPSRYTAWGQLTITGMQPMRNHPRHLVMSYSIRDMNPMRMRAVYHIGGRCPPGQRCWYDPLSWDWQKILDGIWGNVVEPCVHGWRDGIVGSFSTTTAMNLFAYFGSVGDAVAEITPWGFVGVQIAGCVGGIIRQ